MEWTIDHDEKKGILKVTVTGFPCCFRFQFQPLLDARQLQAPNALENPRENAGVFPATQLQAWVT
jgi:hypothetical protein